MRSTNTDKLACQKSGGGGVDPRSAERKGRRHGDQRSKGQASLSCALDAEACLVWITELYIHTYQFIFVSVLFWICVWFLFGF